MADNLIDTFTTTQIELDGNESLEVTSTGSIVTSGADEAGAAVLWDPSTAGTTVPPGIVIVNDGLIQSTGSSAILLPEGATVADPQGMSLTNSGTILAAEDGVSLQEDLDGGIIVIDNYGNIETENGQAIDLNAVESATSITIYNRADGLIHAEDADAVRPGASAGVYNWGLIQAEGNGDGIDFQGDAGGVVNNYAGGLIEGGKHGITGSEAVTVTNAVGGTIVGNNGSAVNIDNDSAVENTVHVTNHGTMEGRSAETVDSDGDAVDTDGLLALENYGSIKGLGHQGSHDDEPNVSEGVATGGGVINNYAGAVIFGYGRGIQVDNSGNGGAFSATAIHNEGVIEGAGNGPEGVDPEDAAPLIPIGNEAINLVGDWADTISNLGQIIGGVMMDAGADTLNNSGSMKALNGSAVDMGADNDTANLATGSSIIGLINGGADSDTINLLGSGSGTLSQVANFETLDVEAGNWTITDDQTYVSGVTVFAGAELVVGEGLAAGSLNAGVITNGVFAINRSDTFTLTNIVVGNGSFEQRGEGTTILDQANGYLGGTLLSGGALRVSFLGAVSTGAVIFGEGGQKLILDDEALIGNDFENAVLSLGFGDAVDFSGLAYAAGTTVTYDEATGLVTVNNRNGVYSFTALGSAETEFTAESDGAGGTQVVLKNIGADIRGTWQNDVVTGQETVLGQSLPTSADDSIDVRRGNDKVDGLAGNDAIFGGDDNDNLAGSDGDDWLYGGKGKNKLSGGEGFNAFVFDTNLGKGKAGGGNSSFAKITDFTIGDDQILLDSNIFKALGVGPLSTDAFAIGKKAKSADVHILFKNGEIRYDKDGEGGKAAVLFAKVGSDLAMDAHDFLVI